jgi:hypothetical protein
VTRLNRSLPDELELPWPKWERTGFALAVLGLSIFYLWTLGRPSLWLDEAWEANYYVGITDAPWYNRPILYMGIVRVLATVFGHSELVLRLLPCAAGIAAVAGTYVLARGWLGRDRAVLAAGLLSIAPPFLLAAHQLKHYTLDALATVALLYAYERFRRSTGSRALVAYVAVAVVSFGLSFTSPFVVAAIAAIEVARRRGDLRGTTPFVAATAVAAVVFFILFAVFYARGPADSLLVEYFDTAYAPAAAPMQLPSWLVGQTVNVLRELTGVSSGLVVVLFLVAGIGSTARVPSATLAAFLPVVALINVGASAFRLYPYGVVRLSVYIAPVVCMLLAAGIGLLLPRDRRPWLAYVAVVAVLYALFYPALTGARPYLSTGWRTEHIRDLVRTLAEEHVEGEALYVNEDAGPAFRFYWVGNGRQVEGEEIVWAGRLARDPSLHAPEIAELSERFDAFWALFSHIDPHELRALRAMLLESYECDRSWVERDARLEHYRRAEALPEPAPVPPIEGLSEGDSGTSGEGP